MIRNYSSCLCVVAVVVVVVIVVAVVVVVVVEVVVVAVGDDTKSWNLLSTTRAAVYSRWFISLFPLGT